MHFALGLAVGTAVLLPSVLMKLRAREKTSHATGKLIAVSYALAGLAIVPNLLRHSGMPEYFCGGWWMNLFLFNPLLDRLKTGGMLIGEILIVLFFILHYFVILAGIIKAGARQTSTPPWS